MSSKLEELSQELKELSVTELTNLIEQAAAELRRKTTPNGNATTENPQTEDPATRGLRLPHAYRPTKEEVEARVKKLRALLTPEELAEMDKIDLSQLPPLPKSITEYISEDREDRF